MQKAFVGIDPGSSGGIAMIDPLGLVMTWKMPSDEEDMVNLMELLPSNKSRPGGYIYIEKVGGFMGEGKGKDKKNAASAHTMFKFGRGVGVLIGALLAFDTVFTEIPPQQWQKGLNLHPKNRYRGKTAWKNYLKKTAQEYFPSEKVTLYNADALLIAEYCRQTRS